MKMGLSKREREMPITKRVHVVGFVLVVLANVIALGPPIHWIIFIVADVIGLEPLINLLNGLPLRWGFIVWDLLFWILVL
jgi:hypothetical protein